MSFGRKVAGVWQYRVAEVCVLIRLSNPAQTREGARWEAPGWLPLTRYACRYFYYLCRRLYFTGVCTKSLYAAFFLLVMGDGRAAEVAEGRGTAHMHSNCNTLYKHTQAKT